MPVAIIGGIVAAAGAVGGALISSHAANSAANTAANAASQNNALQSQIYNSNKALETPYIDSGDTANTALQGFLGLGGDPAATQAAFNDYLDSTGYRFNLNQGLDAVAQGKAASGLLGSGSTVKALDAYGTGLADQYGQQYVDTLGTVANRGANSANALSNTAAAYANAVSSNNNNAASAAGTAAQSQANAFNTLINTASGLYGKITGASSFGGGAAGYNAFAPGG